LNCFAVILEDEAMAAAAAADRAVAKGPVGPLHGVPVAIKDLTPTAGHVTSLGSWTSQDGLSERSALIVERLCAAGAIVIGKTTTPEFASSALTASPRWGEATFDQIDDSDGAGADRGRHAAGGQCKRIIHGNGSHCAAHHI
jgi:Asp-tRNA(Asn)/Glu-tRNA(Gln) amidotransferase A subunit family amidase